MLSRLSLVIVVVVLVATASPAGAQTLGVAGNRLTVDGMPRFLVFISYFDAMRRATAGGAAFKEDFEFFRGQVDGIRILVNWCHREGGCRPAADGLFNAAGDIQDATRWANQSSMNPWDRFVAVLTAAKSHGLLVNVTFTRETLAPPPSLAIYGDAIKRVITRLDAEHPGKFRHVFFDVQNEWTKDKELFTTPALRQLVARVREGRPDAIVTGSQESQAPAQAAAIARDAGFDLLAFHDCRGCSDWHQAAKVAADAGALAGSAGMPIIYDEPTAYCAPGVSRESCRPGDSGDPAHFVAAALNAKAAGVAMWTFHTREAFDLKAASYVSRASANELEILKTIRRRLDAATSSK